MDLNAINLSAISLFTGIMAYCLTAAMLSRHAPDEHRALRMFLDVAGKALSVLIFLGSILIVLWVYFNLMAVVKSLIGS